MSAPSMTELWSFQQRIISFIMFKAGYTLCVLNHRISSQKATPYDIDLTNLCYITLHMT